MAASRSDLRSIAVYQKAVLVCILLNFAEILGQFAIPAEARFLLGLMIIVVGILSTVFVFLLAMKVSSSKFLGILQGILTLIPCVGLIVLLVINQTATTTLQQNGIRVGLLGARLSDLD
jgi:hypothetical protein